MASLTLRGEYGEPVSLNPPWRATGMIERSAAVEPCSAHMRKRGEESFTCVLGVHVADKRD